ncbi:hypothetical protein ILUMI_06084 [Ignelater luminosus]|uniref:NodB homology domain-containing protein n=1 Tax=Ignelater luminosus TaxID=2038154 RepID=A0A8K0GJG7_IGNLU|nr:hypothetical protein ILUMI_06084 [Ignelater luminosus]
MNKLFIFGAIVVSAFAAPRPGYEHYEAAEKCDPNVCVLPYCRCSSTDIPGDLKPSEIPQIVMLTFDDAVSIGNIGYYRTAFNNRKNPDGCPIQTTYYVSHEYTDCSLVNELKANGHEIALHSITHEPPTTRWQNLSVEEHMLEFADEVTLLNQFARIPRDDMQGIRLPFLQLSGDNSFQMIQNAGLKYDSSWPTSQYLWPYTLNFSSTQDCPIGPCPKSSIPGVWVVPMINWKDNHNVSCSMVDSCVNIPQDKEGLVEFMVRNFKQHYEGNRAPFGFYVHAAWFARNPVYFEAYLEFIDYLQKHQDVYLVGVQRALQWVQNPSKLGELEKSWPKCQEVTGNPCKPFACKLKKGEEERYMTICGTEEDCPEVYPWLTNPLGREKYVF